MGAVRSGSAAVLSALISGGDTLAAVALLMVLFGVIVAALLPSVLVLVAPRLRPVNLRVWLYLAVGAAVVGVGDRFGVRPDFDRLPASADALQQLINSVGALSLLICLAQIVIGGAVWGMGSLAGSDRWARRGQSVTLTAVVSAILVGAGAALVNQAFSAGGPAS